MARKERSWNQDFQTYMEEIAKHPNYRGLPIERKRDGSLSWIATAKSKVGQARKQWAENKALELNFTVQPGVYAQVMREIHPTKIHVCQICGSRMSIYYHYPSANFLKAIERKFELEFTECDHVGDIWEQLLESGVEERTLKSFFVEKFGLEFIECDDIREIWTQITNRNYAEENASKPISIIKKGLVLDKNAIIEMCEKACRLCGKKYLSPGAMSNFPDRYDGFHTYNRCCRATQDKGRSKENLKSYTRDRRAYEYWSDGNINAANLFMGSSFFEGASADHIGAISLGFVHDPRYLRPMSSSDNSTKRDRLLVEDIEAILEVETTTGVFPMSWYSAEIWNFIKTKYKAVSPAVVATAYRDMLKQNMTNFMFVLKAIIDVENGRDFLITTLIEPKADYFEHSYAFDSNGCIIKETPRHRTERSKNEFERFARVAFESVEDYNDKENRHLSPDLTQAEMAVLRQLCEKIPTVNFGSCNELLKQLMIRIQERLIQYSVS